MKKIFTVVLSFILIFSGLGFANLQTASADTGLAGTYYIQAKHSGKVLTVEDGNAGAVVTQQDKQDSDYQKWVVTETSNGIYKIMNRASGLVLDVAEGVTTDGANIIQYQNMDSGNQQWRIIGSADGSYEIVSVRSGKYLDVTRSQTQNGAENRVVRKIRSLCWKVHQ